MTLLVLFSGSRRAFACRHAHDALQSRHMMHSYLVPRPMYTPSNPRKCMRECTCSTYIAYGHAIIQ